MNSNQAARLLMATCGRSRFAQLSSIWWLVVIKSPEALESAVGREPPIAPQHNGDRLRGLPVGTWQRQGTYIPTVYDQFPELRQLSRSGCRLYLIATL